MEPGGAWGGQSPGFQEVRTCNHSQGHTRASASSRIFKLKLKAPRYIARLQSLDVRRPSSKALVETFQYGTIISNYMKQETTLLGGRKPISLVNKIEPLSSLEAVFDIG